MMSNQESLKKLYQIAEEIYEDLTRGEVPKMRLAARTRSNIVFNSRYGVWKYGDAKITRSAKKLDGAYMLLRTLYVMEFIKEMIRDKKSSTLREMYYISEGWG